MELMIDDRNCTIDDWRLRKSVDLRPANIGSAIADGARVSTADDLQSRVEAFADLSIKFAAGLPDTYLVRRMAGQFRTPQRRLAPITGPRGAPSHVRISSRRSARSPKRPTNAATGLGDCATLTSGARRPTSNRFSPKPMSSSASSALHTVLPNSAEDHR